jgi:hypothetical protein
VVHFKPPRTAWWGLRIFSGQAGGGGLEAFEGLSGPRGGLKFGLEEKGSPKYLREYRFQSDLTLNPCSCMDIWFHTLMHNLELI